MNEGISQINFECEDNHLGQIESCHSIWLYSYFVPLFEIISLLETEWFDSYLICVFTNTLECCIGTKSKNVLCLECQNFTWESNGLYRRTLDTFYYTGLAQDCDNSIANALE